MITHEMNICFDLDSIAFLRLQFCSFLILSKIKKKKKTRTVFNIKIVLSKALLNNSLKKHESNRSYIFFNLTFHHFLTLF